MQRVVQGRLLVVAVIAAITLTGLALGLALDDVLQREPPALSGQMPPADCGPAIAVDPHHSGNGTAYEIIGVKNGPWLLADVGYAWSGHGATPDARGTLADAAAPGGYAGAHYEDATAPFDAVSVGDRLVRANGTGNVLFLKDGRTVGGTWACI